MNMNNNNADDKVRNDYKYTIVLDGSYAKSGAESAKPAEDGGVMIQREVNEKPAGNAAAAVQREETKRDLVSEHKAAMDRLYFEYEKMCLKEPTVLDMDDAYPHTYHWRSSDRYDPGKMRVLEEALKTGRRVADTEAYQRYVEEVKKLKFAPDSWD